MMSILLPYTGASVSSHTYQVIDTPQMFSDQWERGRRLIGYTQKRTNVSSLASCFSECTKMVPNCLSLNMALYPTLHTSSYICELNFKTVQDDQTAYISDPGYIYYDIFISNYEWLGT